MSVSGIDQPRAQALVWNPVDGVKLCYSYFGIQILAKRDGPAKLAHWGRILAIRAIYYPTPYPWRQADEEMKHLLDLSQKLGLCQVWKEHQHGTVVFALWTDSGDVDLSSATAASCRPRKSGTSRSRRGEELLRVRRCRQKALHS